MNDKAVPHTDAPPCAFLFPRSEPAQINKKRHPIFLKPRYLAGLNPCALLKHQPTVNQQPSQSPGSQRASVPEVLDELHQGSHGGGGGVAGVDDPLGLGQLLLQVPEGLLVGSGQPRALDLMGPARQGLGANRQVLEGKWLMVNGRHFISRFSNQWPLKALDNIA